MAITGVRLDGPAPTVEADIPCCYPSVASAKVFARRWPLYAGLAATWLVVALLMWSFPDTNVGSGVSPWEYAKSQCVVVVQYLRRAVWPTGLLFDYGLPGPTSLGAATP